MTHFFCEIYMCCKREEERVRINGKKLKNVFMKMSCILKLIFWPFFFFYTFIHTLLWLRLTWEEGIVTSYKKIHYCIIFIFIFWNVDSSNEYDKRTLNSRQSQWVCLSHVIKLFYIKKFIHKSLHKISIKKWDFIIAIIEIMI